ncbi:hypothetical protein G7046_g4195 [Stylonectria norvegica]|nr:hypothetical protein G7046_g4195 [Stylonectria norvegica]
MATYNDIRSKHNNLCELTSKQDLSRRHMASSSSSPAYSHCRRNRMRYKGVTTPNVLPREVDKVCFLSPPSSLPLRLQASHALLLVSAADNLAAPSSGRSPAAAAAALLRTCVVDFLRKDGRAEYVGGARPGTSPSSTGGSPRSGPRSSRQGDGTKGTEIHGMDTDVLLKALNVLVKRGKAQIFGQDDSLGVKFF